MRKNSPTSKNKDSQLSPTRGKNRGGGGGGVSFGDLGVGNSGSSNIWRVKKAEKGKDIALSKEEGKKKFISS
jgi:hypothetical protein